MTITCLCVTYGRVSHLEEAIGCFLQQDQPEPKQLLILNTFPSQELIGSFPNVRIINLKTRPVSLGAARNIAVVEAEPGILVTWDDDDLYLPNHLSNFTKAFAANPNADWVRLDKVFYSDKWRVLGTFNTWINNVAFTKDAWQKIGGYSNDLSCGEDRQFFGRLSEAMRGATIAIEPKDIGAIYCWNNAALHISGMGDDKPGQIGGYERTRLALEEQVKRGNIKTGIIHLKPLIDPQHVPTVMAEEYLKRSARESKKNSIAVVELGRFGDIINILPICQHIHDTFAKPHLVVSREFASILDGVSYVEPYPVPLRNDQLNEAMTLAKHQFERVMQTQIWGRNYTQNKVCSAYNVESWRMAGFQHKFKDADWRPLFDRRDARREEALYNKLRGTRKLPMLLVNVTKSVSSPFPQGPAMLESIRKTWSDLFEVVDVSAITCHRFYDLLGLMDRAAALVTIDTGHLHLATASNVPVVALVNPTPWLGSEPRSVHAVRITYEHAAQAPEELHLLIQRATKQKKSETEVRLPSIAPQRRLFHCVEMHEGGGKKDQARKTIAQKSWQALYDKGVVPCHYWEYKRNALSIGDVRPLPYVKDVLEFGMKDASDEDIVFLTNDDNYLHPALIEALRYHVSLYDACCSQRCEFVDSPVPLSPLAPSEFAQRSRLHMGRDLFAATKRWWLSKWEELPDMIAGASDWDLCYAAIVRLEFGIRTTRRNLERSIFPAELERGMVSHQFHKPAWNDPRNVDAAPSQMNNRIAFHDWAAKHLPELKFHSNLAV